MALERFFSPLLQSIANPDVRVAALLFLLCAFGEFAISVPYVLEGVWLLAGYQLGAGVMSPMWLVGLWLAAQGGRQLGAISLYRVVRLGSSPLGKLYDRFRRSRFWPKKTLDRNLAGRVDSMSAFSAGYLRLIGLKIPLLLALAARRRPFTLAKSVLLSSLVWDAAYLVIGLTVGTKALLKPGEMLVASIAGLTVLYFAVFAARRWLRRAQPAAR